MKITCAQTTTITLCNYKWSGVFYVEQCSALFISIKIKFIVFACVRKPKWFAEYYSVLHCSFVFSFCVEVKLSILNTFFLLCMNVLIKSETTFRWRQESFTICIIEPHELSNCLNERMGHAAMCCIDRCMAPNLFVVLFKLRVIQIDHLN